ncbi:MAG: amino acid oxidase, partial [Oscillospiraceae bacterium]|nr:amino acid oxidase [Oscillospiraceae bacterium]
VQLLKEISELKNITMKFGEDVYSIERYNDSYLVTTAAFNSYSTGYLLNTTYASCNEIIGLVGFEPIKIKYELCEIILCEVGDELTNIGITVMDGPFFSIMPFGKTNLHSLTSVTFTPHMSSFSSNPEFSCQNRSNGLCSPSHLSNCNDCVASPKTAYSYMGSLARKYLLEKYSFSYKESLFSMKPIMMTSEVDDSRPTVIRVHSTEPTFISVLSGKINTVYDLDNVLQGDFE